jgi:branched-chain amino acid transport system substrate-binding protein
MPNLFPFVSRRLFLKGSAALVAGTVLAPHFFEAPSYAKGSTVTTLKVGAIVPNARHFLALGRDLTTGLSLALSHAPFSTQLHSLEYDVSLDEAYSAANTLLKEGADVIVATLGTKGAETISALCAEAQRPLIIANTGEDSVRHSANQPFTFHSTLNSWQASYALGQWAASTIGRRGIIASSFYDSGYDTTYAFEAGFVAAGGEVVATKISHHPTDKEGFGGVEASIKAYQPDFIYALYTGTLAATFLADTATQLRIPLLGSPFLTEGYPTPNIYSGGAWSPALKTTANDAFIELYAKATGLAPSPLGLLGWDTGNLLATAFQNAGSADGLGLQAALRTATFASPRGMLRMDGSSQSVVGPLYLRRTDGSTHRIEAELPAPLAPLPLGDDTLRSGWIYPYLA